MGVYFYQAIDLRAWNDIYGKSVLLLVFDTPIIHRSYLCKLIIPNQINLQTWNYIEKY